MSRARRRAAAIAAGIAGIAALLFAWKPSPARIAELAPPAASPVERTVLATSDVATAPPAAMARTVPSLRYDPEHGTKLIRDAYADVDGPCANEPFTVTAVVADTTGGDNVDVSIDGTPGTQVVVRLPIVGEARVHVQARDALGDVDFRTLTVTVRDCKASGAAIDVHTLSGIDRYALVAKPPFAPHDATATYQWDFGDGSKQTTREPYVEHSYAARVQKGPYSSFVVKLEARASGVEPVSGLASLSVENMAYKNRLAAGMITPSAIAGTAMRDGTTIAVPIRFHNYEDVALALTAVRVERHSCDEADVRTDVVAASSLLESTTVPPGDSEVQAVFGGSLANDGFCRAVLTFAGASGGLPVQSIVGVALERAPAVGKPITAETTDPAQRAIFERYTKAAAILQRSHITEEDIAALDAKGAL